MNKIKSIYLQITELQDKLHRRNLLVENLRREIEELKKRTKKQYSWNVSDWEFWAHLVYEHHPELHKALPDWYITKQKSTV